MKTILDLVLLGILILCTWDGYKKGLLMGVLSILIFAVSVYGANLLSNTFSNDVVPALKPFASGYSESMLSGKDSEVLKRMGWEDSAYSVEDLLLRYPERQAEFGAAFFEVLGTDEATAEILARRTLDYAEENDVGIRDAVVHVLCTTVSYLACFILAFLIIVIVLTVIVNLPNLSFKIPRLDLLNDITGALLGLLAGALYCAMLVWALKFMGKLLGENTLAETRIGGYFLEKNFFLKYLGI
jgi:uncharacterized membrane protein required for colicin V production